MTAMGKRNITTPMNAIPLPSRLYLSVGVTLRRHITIITIKYLVQRRKGFAKFQSNSQISLGPPLLLLRSTS